MVMQINHTIFSAFKALAYRFLFHSSTENSVINSVYSQSRFNTYFMIKHTKKMFLIMLLFSAFNLQAQTQLDRYIQEAFANNLVIQEQKLALDKGLIAIKEARSYFMPTTWFETQYTLAQGGRTINIPIGDLLNPVYNTLNQLTSSNKFPSVTNVNEQFLPNNFYDVRIKSTMPIINPDISINRNIKQQEDLQKGACQRNKNRLFQLSHER
jgi:hypothetical protein